MSGRAVNLRGIKVRKATQTRRLKRAKQAWERRMFEAMAASWREAHGRRDEVGRVILCPPLPDGVVLGSIIGRPLP